VHAHPSLRAPSSPAVLPVPLNRLSSFLGGGFLKNQKDKDQKYHSEANIQRFEKDL
jgi:hypothetical protein